MALAVIIVAPVMPVAVIVIFMAPVTFVISPSFPIVVVMWMGPGCARVGWMVVVSGDPTVVLSLWRPKAAHPDHPDGGRWRRRGFIRYRWRRNPDIYRNLSRCGNRKGHPKKKCDQTSVFHVCPPSEVETVTADNGSSLPVKHF
jgi:hypothetical protein